jgi:nucleotide-binding universal stress UspA family protein
LKRILVGYDGSDSAKLAIQVTAELAKKYRAQVTIVTVGGLILSPVDGMVLPTANEDVYRLILDEGQDLCRKYGVEAVPHFPWGDVADQIVTKAEKEKFELIVVGHRGTSGIQRWLTGSVAKKVVDHAPCSVLVVRPNPK